MGGGVGKHFRQAHITYDGSQKGLMSNHDGSTVICTRDQLDLKANTLVSKSSYAFSSKADCLRIQFSAAAVVRIGLSYVDPTTDDGFMQKSIFEIEDGISSGESSRNMFINQFSMLYYGADEKEIEFLLELKTRQLWMYIVTLYGKPKITTTFRRGVEDCSVDLVALKTGGQIDDTSTFLNPNTVLCQTEQVSVNKVYHLRWKMKLENEKGTIMPIGHGLMTLRLSRKSKKADTNTENQEKGTAIWEISSAVKEYPYSGIIAFQIHTTAEIKQIEHNLMVQSVGNTSQETLDIDNDDKSFTLEVEFSSGELSITEGTGQVKQGYGSLFIVNHDKQFRDVDDLKLEIESAVGKRPRRIQYGTSPVVFLAEFNERFAASDLTLLKKTLFRSVTPVQDTSAVQLLGVDDKVQEDDITGYFTRKQVGGGEIKDIKQVDDVPGSWILKFNLESDARKIWMRGQHRVGGTTVHVLPYYDNLGCSVPPKNGAYGDKPDVDGTDLTLCDLDKDKLKFLKGNNAAKRRLQASIRLKVQVEVQWGNVAEFENDSNSETVDGELTFKCGVADSDYQKRALWKEIVKKEVQTFFAKTVVTADHDIDETAWVAAVACVGQYTGISSEILICKDDDLRKIRIIGLDTRRIELISQELGTIKGPKEFVSELLEVRYEQFKALKEEGKLESIENAYQGISFRVDSQSETINICGPTNEVKQAKRDTMSLALNTRRLQIDIAPSVEKYMCLESGAVHIREVLTKRNMSPDFQVNKGKFELMVTVVDEGEILKRTTELKSILKDAVRSETVDAPVETASAVETDSWKAFIMSLETEVVVDIFSGASFQITGPPKTVARTKTELVTYFQETAIGTMPMRIPAAIAEYLNKYKDEHDCEFHQGSSKEYTGKVVISSQARHLSVVKDKLQSDVKSVKTHWLYISKPWLASVVQDITGLKTLVRVKKCMVTADIGQTMALNNIACVAVHRELGAVIQVKLGKITHEIADAIVNSTSPDLEFDRGVSKYFVNKGVAGGMVIQEECRKIIKEKGKLEIGNVFVSGPGYFRCMNIIHAVAPKYKDGKSNEESMMKMTVNAVLKICQESNFISVVMPAFGADILHYPDDLATSHVLQAVSEFLEKNGSSTVKEVYLHADCMEIVHKFSDHLMALKSPWMCFQHKKKLHSEETFLNVQRSRPVSARPGSSAGSRPSSATTKLLRTPRIVRDNSDIMWGNNMPHRLAIGDDDEEDKTDDQTRTLLTTIRRRPRLADSCFKGGLPFNVPITSTLHFHVTKGSLTRQTVDVIVNTTFQGVEGVITLQILKSGGDGLKTEFKALGKLDLGVVKETGGGNLNCKRVFHVVIPERWKSETGRDALSKILRDCLTKVSQAGLKSIAFPAIGTGNCHYPAKDVADVMTKAVCDIANDNSMSSLEHIHIVIYGSDSHTCKVFEEEIPNLVVPFESLQAISDTEEIKQSTYKPRRAAEYVAPPKIEDHSDVDDVAIFKIMARKDIADIKKELERIVDDQIITKSFDFAKLSDERKLSDKEEMTLKTLEKKYGVNVDIDQTNTLVKVHGLKDRVDACEIETIQLLQLDFPVWRNKELLQQRLIRTVQWFYKDKTDQEKKPHDASSNFHIHMGFAKGEDFVYYNQAEDKDYRVLIATQKEHEKHDASLSRDIYQRSVLSKLDITLPESWTITNTQQETAKVQLSATDIEFNDVKTKFIKDGCNATAIVNIYRLEHKYMWNMYQTKKQQIETQNPKGTQNERSLWHGTDSATVDMVVKGGYDRSFCGRNATVWGKGAYFAVSSHYSNRYAPKDGSGIQRMFLNCVLTGLHQQGRQDMPYLEKRTVVNNIPIFYDSASDNHNPPHIYVIFHDSQVYPEYLIEYRT